MALEEQQAPFVDRRELDEDSAAVCAGFMATLPSKREIALSIGQGRRGFRVERRNLQTTYHGPKNEPAQLKQRTEIGA